MFSDTNTYTFDGSGLLPDGQAPLPDLATPSNRTGYCVYLEFKADTYRSIAGYLWYMSHGQLHAQLKLEKDGVQVNIGNELIDGSEGSIFYGDIPFTNIGLDSDWHSIAFSIPTGTHGIHPNDGPPFTGGSADDPGFFVLDGDNSPDGYVNITSTSHYHFNFNGITERASTEHNLGTRDLGNDPWKGQIRNLLICDSHVRLDLLTVLQTSGTTAVSEQGETSDTFAVRLGHAPGADVTLNHAPPTGSSNSTSEPCTMRTEHQFSK